MSASEPISDRARIEDLETQSRVLGEAHAATWERMDRIKAELETRLRQIDGRVMAIDVKLGQKIEDLSAALQQELGNLEQKTDGLGQRLDALDQKLVAIERKRPAERSAE